MSTFDFSTLITDRTASDVQAAKALLDKINNGTATEGEQAAFNAAAMKGAYNYTDLNRVSGAVYYLDEILEERGYSSGVKKIVIPHDSDQYDPYVWYESDVPTAGLMAQHLANVLAVYNTLLSDPDLPETLEKLDYNGENQMEEALLLVKQTVDRIAAGYYRSNAFAFWSGREPLPTEQANPGRNWAALDAMRTTWANWQAASWYLLLYGNLEAEGVVE